MKEDKAKILTYSMLILGVKHQLFSRGDALINYMNIHLGIPKIVVSSFSHPNVPTFIMSNLFIFFRLLQFISRHKRKISILLLFSLLLLPSAYLLKKFKLIRRLVYDDADYMPIFSRNIFSKSANSLLETLALRSSDIVVSASIVLRKKRENIARKIISIPNGVDDIFCRFNLENEKRPIDVIYVGNLGNDYIYLTVVLEALAMFVERYPDTNIIFVGFGKDAAIVKNYASRFKQIKYLGRLDRKDIAELLSKSKIGLAPYIIKGSARFGVPMKIKEYLASSLCILTTNIPSIIDFLQKVGACYEFVNEPSAYNFFEAIERLYSKIIRKKDETIKRNSTIASYICKEYNWAYLSKRYIKSVFEALR